MSPLQLDSPSGSLHRKTVKCSPYGEGFNLCPQPLSLQAGWRMACGESRRAVTRQLGAMIIGCLNKRVSHGSGVCAGTAPCHWACIHTGVAAWHSSSHSRTCSSMAFSYVEREKCRCLLVQRSTSLRWEHLCREEQKELRLKSSLPTYSHRDSHGKTKVIRGAEPFSLVSGFHQRPWDTSCGHYLQAVSQGQSWESPGPSPTEELWIC